jgi:TPR repeat protein
MYFHGLGAPQSYALALARYRAAAELGSLEAWRNVASMHALGQGVAQSRETARAMMRMVERIEREQMQQAGGAAPAPAEKAAAGAAGGGGGGCGKCGQTGTDGCG